MIRKLKTPQLAGMKRFFSVPDTFDPDDLRMRQILNIVLITLTLLAFLAIVFLFIPSFGFSSPQTLLSNSNAEYVLKPSLLGMLIFTGLFFLNRWKRAPRNVAGALLVLLMTFMIMISDDPVQLVNGRTLMFWMIPIILTVIVLPPVFVYVTDVVIAIIIIALTSVAYSGQPLGNNLNIYAIGGLLVLSIMAWLGMEIANRSIRAARTEAKKNAAILDGVADGVVVVGLDGRMISANPVAEQLTNGELRSLLGQEQANIGGRYLQLNWSAVPGVGQVAIVRDISRQVEIERAKDAVLAIVSHEMRTPLAAISGFAELMIRTSELSSAQRMARRISENTGRLLRLIDNLLDQAQIEAGALQLRHDPYSPALLAHSVEKLFSETARGKGVMLTAMSEGLPQRMFGDVDRLQQILVNLVGNAIKFTDKGGRVDVSLFASSDSRWQIVVRDTGIGIPPERLPDIFEPFRRSSDYATRQHQGAGLGLSIVKQLSRLMNGDVAVTSMPGEGSTFTVILPMEAEKQ